MKTMWSDSNPKIRLQWDGPGWYAFRADGPNHTAGFKVEEWEGVPIGTCANEQGLGTPRYHENPPEGYSE